MDTHLVDRPAFRLAGHATRVPLIHQGVNLHIQEHIAALPPEEHLRLKALGDTEPKGLLQVTDDLDPDGREGSELNVGSLPYQRTASAGPADDLGGDRDRVVPLQPVAAAVGPLGRRGPRAHGRFQHRDLRAMASRRTSMTHHRPSNAVERLLGLSTSIDNWAFELAS
jgi:hypothetical protein